MEHKATVAKCAPESTARSCENHTSVSPPGVNRGHIALRVDRVSKIGGNFGALVGSSGTCARYAADGLLKQNTSPNRRDVLSKLSMLDRHTGHTSASESESESAELESMGAHTGPDAATPCSAMPGTRRTLLS
jgi:hypothetical protein